MATYLENLVTARDNLAAALATYAGRPNVNFEGESVDYGELFKRWQSLSEIIAQAGGPVEEETQGIV